MQLINKIRSRYWSWVIQSPYVNYRVNRLLGRIKEEEESVLDVLFETIHLFHEDYERLLSFESFKYFNQYNYRHRKLMEYATSYKLISQLDGVKDICDFASGGDAFASFVKKNLPNEIEIVSIDPLNSNEVRDGIRYVNGTAAAIKLPNSSLDVITCHHSIEHFRNNQDISAVTEFMRLLRPGGLIVILPIFLTDRYAEIWNRAIEKHFDPRSLQIIDRFSPFPGWGNFEHFARVYDVKAFQERILNSIDRNTFDVLLHNVKYENKDVPDMQNNRSLPSFCSKMLALTLRKI